MKKDKNNNPSLPEALIDLSGVDFPKEKVDAIMLPETLIDLSGVDFPENKRIDTIDLSR